MKVKNYLAVLPRVLVILTWFTVLLVAACNLVLAPDGRVKVVPAPPGEALSPDFQVSVAGQKTWIPGTTSSFMEQH